LVVNTNSMIVIKFRGLRTDGGGWAYGNLINWHPNLKPRIIWFEQVGETSQELDFNETNDEVHHETVGQFTGLIDKKGVDIYEHDKLDNDEVVAWSIEQGCFFAGHSPLCMSASHREVIGNIHELTT